MKALTALRVRETGLIAEGIVALGVAQASCWHIFDRYPLSLSLHHIFQTHLFLERLVQTHEILNKQLCVCSTMPGKLAHAYKASKLGGTKKCLPMLA